MQTRARNNAGMTLVELMIVVVIIGVLAAIAVVGYRKYVGNARLSEATAMLAEFAAKEQLYFLDNGQYMEAHNGAVHYPSENESAVEFWPHNPVVRWDSAREAHPVDPLPATWRRLGIRPRWKQLFCTYMANAGPPGAALPGFVGPTQWAASPNVPWFYAIAVCNLVGDAGWDGDLARETIMVLNHDSPQIRTFEEKY